MRRVRRIDSVTLIGAVARRSDAVEVTSEEFRLYDARFAIHGFQDYPNARGDSFIEFRPWSEVNDSLASYELRPLTDLHPPANVTTDSARVLARGATSAGRWDDDGRHVAGRLAVWDAALQLKFDQAEAAGRVMQLSAGYTLDLDETPGVHQGTHYDAVQRNIRINHVAAVPLGRAGTAQVILDAAGGWCMDDARTLAEIAPHRDSKIYVDFGRWSRRDAADLRSQRQPARSDAPPKTTMKTIKFKFDGGELNLEVADDATPLQIAQAAADAIPPEFLAQQKKKKEEGKEADKKKTDAFELRFDELTRRTDALATAKAIIGLDYAGATAHEIHLDTIESVMGKDARAEIDAIDKADRHGAASYAFRQAVKTYGARDAGAGRKHAARLLKAVNDARAEGGDKGDGKGAPKRDAFQEAKKQRADEAEHGRASSGS